MLRNKGARDRDMVGRVTRGVLVIGLFALAGCAATYQNHGYMPPEEDLEQIVVG